MNEILTTRRFEKIGYQVVQFDIIYICLRSSKFDPQPAIIYSVRGERNIFDTTRVDALGKLTKAVQICKQRDHYALRETQVIEAIAMKDVCAAVDIRVSNLLIDR